jgi:nicotinamide-nucleotide amidase
MKALVLELAKKLKSRGWKLATVESCTGGGLAYGLTSVAGSSDWFERGFITYSNLSKQKMVGVRPVTLASFGAVSVETAREMAEGAQRASHTQLCVAITGIAGPGGGTEDKPVGMVCFAWTVSPHRTVTKTEYLSGTRTKIRKSAINIALEGLLQILAD